MTALAELLPPHTELRVPEIETYRGFENPRPLQRRGVVVLTELDLQGQRHPLTKPLSLKLVSEEQGWFAENQALNLFGVGDSPKQAVDDFRRHFEHFLQRYRSLDWSEVSGEGKRLKILYEQLLGPDAA